MPVFKSFVFLKFTSSIVFQNQKMVMSEGGPAFFSCDIYVAFMDCSNTILSGNLGIVKIKNSERC